MSLPPQHRRSTRSMRSAAAAPAHGEGPVTTTADDQARHAVGLVQPPVKQEEPSADAQATTSSLLPFDRFGQRFAAAAPVSAAADASADADADADDQPNANRHGSSQEEAATGSADMVKEEEAVVDDDDDDDVKPSIADLQAVDRASSDQQQQQQQRVGVANDAGSGPGPRALTTHQKKKKKKQPQPQRRLTLRVAKVTKVKQESPQEEPTIAAEASTLRAGLGTQNIASRKIDTAAAGSVKQEQKGEEEGQGVKVETEQERRLEEGEDGDDEDDSLFGDSKNDDTEGAGGVVAGATGKHSKSASDEAKPRRSFASRGGGGAGSTTISLADTSAGASSTSVNAGNSDSRGLRNRQETQEDASGAILTPFEADSSSSTSTAVHAWPARTHQTTITPTDTTHHTEPELIDVNTLDYPEFDDAGHAIAALTTASTRSIALAEEPEVEVQRGPREPRGARTLLDVCRGVMMRLAPRYDDIGDLSYAQHPLFFDTRPVDQLGELERNSPNLRDETDPLWKKFVAAKDGLMVERVHTGQEEAPKSWRKLYKRIVRNEMERKAQAVEEMKQLYASELAARQERATRKTSDLLPVRRRGSGIGGPSATSGVKPTLLGKMRAQAVTERRDRASAVAEQRRRSSSAATPTTRASDSLGTRKPPAGLGMAPKRLGPTGTARRRAAATKAAPTAKTSFSIRSTLKPLPDVASLVEASSAQPIDVDAHVPHEVIDLEAPADTTTSSIQNLFHSSTSHRPAVKIKKRLVSAETQRADRSDSDDISFQPHRPHASNASPSPTTRIRRRISSGPTLFMPRKRPKIS